MNNRFYSILSSVKKRLPRILIGFILVAIFSLQAGSWITIPLIERLDGILYDTKVRLSAADNVDPRVVIIDIDEKSLQEREKGGEGRWPWPTN